MQCIHLKAVKNTRHFPWAAPDVWDDVRVLLWLTPVIPLLYCSCLFRWRPWSVIESCSSMFDETNNLVVVKEFGCHPPEAQQQTNGVKALGMTPASPHVSDVGGGLVGYYCYGQRGNQQLWTTCAKVWRGGREWGEESNGRGLWKLFTTSQPALPFQVVGLILISDSNVLYFNTFQWVLCVLSFSFSSCFFLWKLMQTDISL